MLEIRMDIDRRRMLITLLGFHAAATVGIAPSNALAAMTYEEAIRAARAPLQPTPGDWQPRDRELVRLATLAANSHNTQPWVFITRLKQIVMAPDYSRRCPAVDPDDHHLFVSLGCAAENLILAASALGFRATPQIEGDRIVIDPETASRRRVPRDGRHDDHHDRPAAHLLRRRLCA
jgi:nitroreductase